MIRYLLIFFVIAFAVSQNPQPYPTCTALPGISDIPIALQQTQVYNMDDLFKGFNLNIQLKNGPSFAYLRDKFTLKGDLPLDLKGVRNYHLDHVDNAWGKNFITITDRNYTTTIKWGRLPAADTVPVIQGTVIVQQQQNVFCYDAVLFPEQNLALIDCALRSGTTQHHVYFNRFYYVNTLTQQVLPGFLRNQMYVAYSQIWRRSIYKYTENGYHYLMRIYFADGVDQQNRGNTYMEIYAINNPQKPFILRVMDRTFLGLKTLTIMDFKLYLGDMYILDYHQGVIKFDVTPAQQIVIAGFYRSDSGFIRMGVYSNNLDNQFLLVLANNHAVYQIDWTDQIRPKILTKYSILADSWVNSIAVNQKYVVVQSQANVTRTSGVVSLYNMTWVFTRNSRLYTNAYAVINHDSFNTFIDFNRDLSAILSIDEQSISVYQVDTPYLSLVPILSSDLNKEFLFNVNARSLNPITNQSSECSFTFKFIIVQPDNFSLWPTGITLPKQYYANYPGELFIPLYMFTLGPNITYGVQESSVSGELPAYWILQQNHSKLNWDLDPSVYGEITFIRQEQYDSLAETDLYIYLQNTKNVTYAAECTTEEFKSDVNCSIVLIRDSTSKILNLTANRFHYYQGRYLHLTAIVYENDPNTIIIDNIENGRRLWNLTVGQGFAGRITSVQFTNGFLIAVLRYAKSIVVWDMNRCQDFGVCQPISLIDAPTMKKIGVNYFSPLQTITSDFHPYVLFIQTMDSVVIVDFTRKGPLLIDVISSPGTKETGYFGWMLAVSQNFLVIVNAPDIIEEHSLLEMETRKTFLTKRYPLYGYTIPENFDVDFSDAGDMVYVSAIQKSTNLGVVLVYHAGYPTVSTLYDVFPTNSSFNDMFVEVTGSFVDYVTILRKTSKGTQVNIFRQYQIPILVFQNTFSDFSFNVTYGNTQISDKIFLSNSTVNIANYPTNIVINNPKLNDGKYLNSLLNYKNDDNKYVINDHQWFNGTVVNYELKCAECGKNKKLELIDHVYESKDVIFSFGMYDIDISRHTQRIVIQHFENIIELNHNGSIQKFISMPKTVTIFGQHCTKIVQEQFSQYFISGCVLNNEVNLYLTSQISSKPFSMGPQRSSAEALDTLVIRNQLLFLTDIDLDPSATRRPGSIIVYALNVNPDELEIFDELEVIDSNDFTGIKDWDPDVAYLGGLAATYNFQADIYRMYVTQLTYGLFIVDFKWKPQRPQINLIKTSFINLRDILIQENYPIPNAASFRGVTVLQQTYDSKTQNWNIDIIVSVRNFHNFQINIMLDRTSSVLYSHVVSVYYRYSFYESNSYIKSFDGYFVNTQTLPSVFQGFTWFTPQIIAVYDTRPNRTEQQIKNQETVGAGIPAFHMMGGLKLPDQFQVSFAFNYTRRRNESDPFSNIGLVAIDSSGQEIKEIALSESLHIVTHKGVKSSQHIELIANNDYSHISLPIKIHLHNGVNGIPGWAIALIVIGSVAFASGIAFGIWFWWKTKNAPVEPEIKKSLLEEQADKSQQEDQKQDQADDGVQAQAGGSSGSQQDLQQGEKPNQQNKGTQITQGTTKKGEETPEPVSRQGAVNESIALSEKQ